MKGNSKVIERSISSSDHWATLSAPLSRLPHPARIISMGLIQKFEIQTGAEYGLLLLCLFISPARALHTDCFDLRFWAAPSDGRKSSRKGTNDFIITSKKQDKDMLRTGLFGVCDFDLKQTQCHSRDPAVHMSVRRRSGRPRLLWTV